MQAPKDNKKRSVPSPAKDQKIENKQNNLLELKIDGPPTKRQKLPDGRPGDPTAAVAAAHQKKELSNAVPIQIRAGLTGTAAATAAAAAALQQTSVAKNIGAGSNGLSGAIPVVTTQGSLANMAAAASLVGPLGTGVPPPHLVAAGHPQALLAGQNPGFPGLNPGLGNQNQIKSFLDHISLGQYWRLLSENGCDSLDDLGSADVQMLVNLGFKIFHANRLVTAVHRFIRPAPTVISQPTKRKRASHVRTFSEMYQRVEEFQNLVNQVGSMSAAERDPRSTISRGAYTQYLRIKELAEKESIDLTSEKYVNVKPTEKNVKEIIAKEKAVREATGVTQPQVPGVVPIPGVPNAPPGSSLPGRVVGMPQVLGE
ncbi:hypothetical protein AAMO2058_000629800 [Amorphochlora amoebiformis]|eukprot:1383349-Amorphochlora_amoeboformis.AAC.1